MCQPMSVCLFLSAGLLLCLSLSLEHSVTLTSVSFPSTHSPGERFISLSPGGPVPALGLCG